MTVRVRFAPSPTGSLHIGGLRTALFNWLYARRHGGAFVLRVEDTDQTRYDPQALTGILDALAWVGLDVDEGPHVGGAYGPYVQSERTALYQEHAQRLVAEGKAYYDSTTSDELAAINEAKRARGVPPGYRRGDRQAYLGLSDNDSNADRPRVVRFDMPREGSTTVVDVLRGDVTFEHSTLQDLVLLKSDGFPTYHLANVVDDHLMRISHIFRANEWLASAPIHKLLYQAFGWEMPQIAHLPLMLNPNGQGKMSKRNPPRDAQGNIIPVAVSAYREAGYLPEAMFNFLASVGWSIGEDRDVFTRDEAVAVFDIADVNVANSAYPYDKLRWLNGKYIRDVLSVDDLATRLRAPLEAAGYTPDDATLHAVAPLVQTRIETLNDVVPLAGFLFAPTFTPPTTEALVPKKMDPASAQAALDAAVERLAALSSWEAEALEAEMRALAEALGQKVGPMFSVLRAAVTGVSVSPPLFETMVIVGRTATLERLRAAAARLAATPNSSLPQT